MILTPIKASSFEITEGSSGDYTKFRFVLEDSQLAIYRHNVTNHLITDEVVHIPDVERGLFLDGLLTFVAEATDGL